MIPTPVHLRLAICPPELQPLQQAMKDESTDATYIIQRYIASGLQDRGHRLCICFEVAHYLTAAMGDKLVKICARSATLVFFSSAHTKEGGYGHINEQPREYWIERFFHSGFELSEPKTGWLKEYLRIHLVRGKWFSENICVFEKLPRISVV